MIRLKMPGLLEYRDLAVRMIVSACNLANARRVNRITGVSRRDHEFDQEVVSAFGEAFNNVAIHGYARQGGDVEIEIETTPSTMTIRVMDYGGGFDIAAVPQPDLDTMPESGLGIYIMRSCMDDVTYENGSPNVLTMSKNLVRVDDGVAVGAEVGAALADKGRP